MTTIFRTSPCVPQAGVSLIELMVSMVIGMLVVLAATQLFSGNINASRATQSIVQIQDGARIGFDTLTRHVRMAGYHPVASLTNFNSGNVACANQVVQAICGINDQGAPTPNLSDEVRVRFWGTDGTVVGTADSATVDCEGLVVSSTQIVEERFHIVNLPTNPGDATTNTPTLVCDVVRGAGNIALGGPVAAQVPLVYGVDTMQVLYGEDSDGNGNPDIWRNATAANMANVVGVQIAMVLRGEGRNNPSMPYTYRLFGETYGGAAVGDPGANFLDPNDQRARRVVSFSVNLRNRVRTQP
ncbi:PilW family protein [Niveibacterium sp.]|uniref:PilW family protein n=1 Tax=Niveibacterium sp. TaxID=2017444 RepID=UPI0035B4F613